MMFSATINLTKAELETAVMEYLHRKGLDTTDRFSVSVRTTPGDRPYDVATTEITVTGVVVGKP